MGQVTRSVDTERGQLSPQEMKTVEAIVRARYYMVVCVSNDTFFYMQLPNILITLQRLSLVNYISWSWRWTMGHDERI